MNKKIVLIIFCLSFFLSVGAVSAQTTQNPDVNRDNKVDAKDVWEVLLTWLGTGNCKNIATSKCDLTNDGKVNTHDFSLVLRAMTAGTPVPTATVPSGTPSTAPTTTQQVPGESMAMSAWGPGGKNIPDPRYDTCTDGTNIVTAHKEFYVIGYDAVKYPTWHPPVVVNPITNVGTCKFGHEHGTDPQKYAKWDEVYKFFGKDMNGDGTISPMVIAADGKITPGDRAGLPFGIANEHMEMYYNPNKLPPTADSYFVRHEDHVGHKIEIMNNEAGMGNTSSPVIDGSRTKTTHNMAQLPNTIGINVPYYQTGSETYQPTGVSCAHLHKFHQGTSSADAVRNNLHEVIFHSTCQSVNVNNINAQTIYPNNSVILTGMMSFGDPGGYKRFCVPDRNTNVCPDGTNSNGSCKITDPLISKLPNAVYSTTLGRNMVDRACLTSLATSAPGSSARPYYFNPYEIWQGDLRIKTPAGKEIAEHGRQWDVLDPIRFIDPTQTDPAKPLGIRYNQQECGPGGLLYRRTADCAADTVPAYDSPQAYFKGLHRTTYFGRNQITNQGGATTWWTDPLGSNAVTTPFASGLKQFISPVNANINDVQYRVQQLYGGNHFLNDRAVQREFYSNSSANTIHVPN